MFEPLTCFTNDFEVPICIEYFHLICSVIHSADSKTTIRGSSIKRPEYRFGCGGLGDARLPEAIFHRRGDGKGGRHRKQEQSS